MPEELLSSQFVNNPVRKRVVGFILKKLETEGNACEILAILQLLTLFLKNSLQLESQAEFQTEIMQHKEEVKRVTQKLFEHPEASVRKNLVNFYVQGFHFFSEESFAELT